MRRLAVLAIWVALAPLLMGGLGLLQLAPTTSGPHLMAQEALPGRYPAELGPELVDDRLDKELVSADFVWAESETKLYQLFVQAHPERLLPPLQLDLDLLHTDRPPPAA